jgi:acyl carrier protein
MSANHVIELILQNHILDVQETMLPESDLFALGLDSLAVMQLLLALETAVAHPIPQAEVSREHLRTPQTIAAWISSHA